MALFVQVEQLGTQMLRVEVRAARPLPLALFLPS